MASPTREEVKVKKKAFFTQNILQFKVEYRNTPPQVIVSKVNTFIQKPGELGLQNMVLSWKIIIIIQHELNLCICSIIA